MQTAMPAAAQSNGCSFAMPGTIYLTMLAADVNVSHDIRNTFPSPEPPAMCTAWPKSMGVTCPGQTGDSRCQAAKGKLISGKRQGFIYRSQLRVFGCQGDCH